MKDTLLYPIIVTVLSTILLAGIAALYRWCKSMRSEKLKNKILDYLERGNYCKTDDMVSALFKGKEPKNLESILVELEKAGKIKELGADGDSRFANIRRLD